MEKCPQLIKWEKRALDFEPLKKTEEVITLLVLLVTTF